MLHQAALRAKSCRVNAGANPFAIGRPISSSAQRHGGVPAEVVLVRDSPPPPCHRLLVLSHLLFHQSIHPTPNQPTNQLINPRLPTIPNDVTRARVQLHRRLLHDSAPAH